MGSSCGILKTQEEIKQVEIPQSNRNYQPLTVLPYEQAAKIGKFYPEMLSDNSHAKEWEKLIGIQDTTLITEPKLSKDLSSSIFKGIPVEYRWRTWKRFLIQNNELTDEEYKCLELVGEPHLSTIQRDLDRSFPNEAYFNKDQYGSIGQAALERVLCKFANSYKQVGYCQGMNFVAGFLLIISGGNEIEVYLVLQSLFKNFGFEGFYSEGMPYLHKCVWVAKALIRKRYNKLYLHLLDQSIPEDLWLLKWIMTVFTIALHSSILVRVWDVFIVKGVVGLFKAVLAMVFFIQSDLLVKDTGEICEYFASIKEHSFDPEKFVRQLKACKLTKNQIKKLMDKYDATLTQTSSPSKEKSFSSPEHYKLPPLKITPVKVLTPRVAHLQVRISRGMSGNFSPTSAKLTSIPALPDIKRKSIKKKSFGLTNRSCEITINADALH